MANVTYLIGAGASAGKRYDNGTFMEGLPCVNEIPRCVENIITLLQKPIPDNITWTNTQIGLNSRKDWEKARNVVLQDFQKLHTCCKENATIDTYAKKLVLKNEIEEFRHLEQILTLFFMFEQISLKPDSRYDTFLANILTDKLHFPDNIRVISWNYDNQFEIAYSEYNTNDNLLVGSKKSSFNVKHEITKINGTADFLNSDTNLPLRRKNLLLELQDIKETDFYDQRRFRNERLMLELIFLYQLFINGKRNNTNLSFAFDTEFPSNTILQSIDNIIGITNVLVIIGYTFPFFNREIDRQILKYITPHTKIYIQDLYPERIKQSLKAVLPDIKEDNIVLLKEVDQFFLPPEL